MIKRRPRAAFSRVAALVCLSAALAIACRSGSHSAEAPQAAQQKSPVDEIDRWVFHPLAKAETSDEVDYRGGRVEVDRAGSRWLILPGREPEVGPYEAPEPLAAILRVEGGFAVVGDSGAVYFSQEALSPLEDSRTPPERFVMTRRVGTTLLGITRSGRIQRSTDLGKRWESVGPDEHFVELAVAGDRTVLAYAAPERWFRSTDEGKTFTALKIPPLAPRKLARLTTGQIYLQGLYDTFVFRRGHFEAADLSVRRAIRQQSVGSDYKLPSFAGARNVSIKRAIFAGDEYYELRSPQGTASWRVAQGGLRDPLVFKEVKGLRPCGGSFHLIGDEKHRLVICQEENTGEVSPRLRLFRVRGESSRFRKIDGAFRGNLAGVRAALSPRGEIALSGLCVVPEKGCAPSGVTLIDGKGVVTHAHAPGVPVLHDIAYGNSGGLWLTGARRKDGHLIVFGPLGGKLEPAILDLTRLAQFPQLKSSDQKTVVSLLPGSSAESLLAVSLLTAQAGHLALVDPQGELVSVSRSPPGASTVHGGGRFLAALDSTEGVLWESVTGGLSWNRRLLPRALCSGLTSECSPRLACSKSGCLIGEELARIGWGSQRGIERPELPLVAEAGGHSEPGLGYECTVKEGDWISLPGLSAIPGADSASLGETAWTQALIDTSRASLTALHVPLGRQEIIREELFVPISASSHYSFFVSDQVEGVAAVRFPHPLASRSSSLLGSSSPLTPEVVWVNRVTGVTGRATLRHPSLTASSTPLLGGSSLRNHRPELLSVAGHGVYLQLLVKGGTSPTFFVTGRDKQAHVEELRDVQWPEGTSSNVAWVDEPSLRQTRKLERVRLNGHHSALMQFAARRVVTITQGLLPSGEVAGFAPYLVGLVNADSIGYAQGVGLSYQGQHPGLLSRQVNLDGPGHRASFIPLNAVDGVGEPVPVPLQQDLESRVEPCTEAERKTTPRVIAPGVVGSGRRIVIHGLDSGSLEMISDDAVLYGTVEQPCLAALEGRQEGAPIGVGRRYQALVFPLETSWLFRRERSSLGQVSYSARRVSCRAEGAESN